MALYCDAEGTPEPNIFWLKDENTMKYTSRIYLSTDNKTLNIDHIKESDAGHYVCVAENILGSDEASATVDVINPYGPPVLLYEPYDIEAIPGTTIELPCGADGDPIPVVCVFFFCNNLVHMYGSENKIIIHFHFCFRFHSTVEMEKGRSNSNKVLKIQLLIRR